MTESFRHPMTLGERIFGLIYLPLHAVGLPFLISWLWAGMPETSEIWADVALYACGLLVCLVFLHSFLKQSFRDLLDHPLRFFGTLIVCGLAYFALSSLVGTLMNLIPSLDVSANPNNETAMELGAENSRIMTALTVFMAPILEECLFRGALFGTIRRKSRLAAYLAALFLFAFYHLWSVFVFAYDSSLWWYLLQYLPAGLVLCYAYERSGTIWCPIVLHALINALALYVQNLL